METRTSLTIQKHGCPCNFKKDYEDMFAGNEAAALRLNVLLSARRHTVLLGKLLREMSAVNVLVFVVETTGLIPRASASRLSSVYGLETQVRS